MTPRDFCYWLNGRLAGVIDGLGADVVDEIVATVKRVIEREESPLVSVGPTFPFTTPMYPNPTAAGETPDLTPTYTC